MAVMIAASLLGGCTHTSVSLRSTNSPAPPGNSFSAGTSASSAALQADVNPGTYFGFVLAGYMLASFQDGYRRWGYGTMSPYSRTPPEMAADRVVTEQDCTRPAYQSIGNLRCK